MPLRVGHRLDGRFERTVIDAASGVGRGFTVTDVGSNGLPDM
jgi:hypothetical protein